MWQSSILAQFPNIYHGSTTKKYGALRFADDMDIQTLLENRQTLARDNGFDLASAALVHQVHGADVIVASPEHRGRGTQSNEDLLGPADAIVTTHRGLTLVINTADCVPVFFYDPQQQSIGVAHAGWPGTAAGIVQATIRRLESEYGSQAAHLRVAVGPSICGAHYDVSTVPDNRVDQFLAIFGDDPSIIRRAGPKVALDLPQACKRLCLEAGIPEPQIDLSGICTHEAADQWPSYRRAASDLASPIWSYIGLRTT